MDILVKWENGTENIVSSADIEVVGKYNVLEVGQKIKMYWSPTKKWYFGSIILLLPEENERSQTKNFAENPGDWSSSDEEFLINFVNCVAPTDHNSNENEDSSDNEPLINLIKKPNAPITIPDFDVNEHDQHAKIKNLSPPKPIQSNDNEEVQAVINNFVDECDSPMDDSDADPTYVQMCEVKTCKTEIFSTCHICLALLCYHHFINLGPCNNDHVLIEKTPSLLQEQNVEENDKEPEHFWVDGSAREEVHHRKAKRINKRKVAQELRNAGQQYISPKTKSLVLGKNTLKPRCCGITCEKLGRLCSTFTEPERQGILDAFYGTASLQLQREYIVRYVRREPKKETKTKSEASRRIMSNYYFLPKENGEVKVCKQMFLNTLNVSEKTVRTALAKKKISGIVEKEKRGGRPQTLKNKDDEVTNAIRTHIQRFPRMESHYCRKSTSREYLHPDLNLTKMFDMFVQEYHNNRDITTTYQTYGKVFRSLNLSFHHPKKDVCGLCIAFREGDNEKKAKLQEEYTRHIKEKVEVRKKKELAKLDPDNSSAALVFDLQQVIMLPKSNESKLFYKRRLSNYNFTIYNLKTKQCDCYLWHECISKRGASEISTCLYNQLQILDKQEVEEVKLFADGCSGQNKNSVVASMLLHSVCSLKNLKCISLSFFVPYHGQNEGDSVHSAITYSINKAAELVVPSQLIPVCRLARKKNPYLVHALTSEDFLDFKSQAVDLRILSVRQDDNGNTVDWTKMCEFMVKRSTPNKIYFKDSHLLETYRVITLKQRSKAQLNNTPLRKLNTEPPKISREKFKDLMALCEGDTPVIKLPEHQNFYKSLPHST